MATAQQSAHPTLRGIVTARWLLLGLFAVLILGQIVAGDAARSWLGWMPTGRDARPLAALWMVWASINLATQIWLRNHVEIRPPIVGLHLVVDVAAITALLWIAGGPTNPFTTLYIVPITLATQISARWTWGTVAAGLAGFAALLFARPLPAGVGREAFIAHMHGLLGAFAFSFVLVGLLVHRITASANRARDELARLRDANIQDQHLAALGTLAAGAAHELGTPLGTVNLLAAELPHMADDERRSAIDTIKREVARCKDILQRMASPEVRVSALSARDAQPWPLAELESELDDPEGVALRVTTSAACRDERGMTTLARASLGQIVRELVANAAEACRRRKGSTGVDVRIDVHGGYAVIEVEDDGAGMEPHVASAVFDPFFTTKPEGQGMGLGLYLARAQLHQLGGEIELDSRPQHGTLVRVRVAQQPPDPYALP